MAKRFQGRVIAPGDVIDSRYEVIKALGVGAIGTALLVLDRELEGQSLVLKVLNPQLASDQNTVKRFYAEAVLARQLTHPNILRVYDVGSSGDLHYLTMEYVEGCSLDELLSGCSGRRLPFEEACHILLQIAVALSVAHEREIIHRDVKPTNILIDRSGIVKLTDFGIAKSVETSFGLTQTGELLGTPAYMAPEQFANAGNASSDLYAWGILAFEVLTGTIPFDGTSAVQVMHQHRTEPIPLDRLREQVVPEWFVSLVESCTAKLPKDRPVTTRMLVSRLKQDQSSASTAEAQRSVSKVVKRRQRSHFLLSDGLRRNVRMTWIFIVVLASVMTYNEKVSRQRIATQIVAVHQTTGMPIGFFLAVLGFGSYTSLTTSDLEEALASGDIHDVRLLLNSGLDPNKHSPGAPPLLHQALNSPYVALEELCLKGANTEARDARGDTALLRAVREGLAVQAYYLLKTCEADARSEDRAGNAVLFNATQSGDIPLVETILTLSKDRVVEVISMRNAAGLSVLHLAAQNLDAPIVKYLLAYGMDPNIRDSNGRSPLHLIVQQPVSEQAVEIARLLLSHQASIDARNDIGVSVLEASQRSAWASVLTSGVDDGS